MIDPGLQRAIVFSAPLVGAFICLILTALDASRSPHPVYRKIHRRMVAAYSLFALAWTGLVLHAIAGEIFLWVIPFFIPLVMACYALYYRVVRTITDSGGSGLSLPLTHFILPALVLAGMIAVWLTVPADRLPGIVYGTGGGAAKYLVVVISLVYSMVYAIMGLVEIWRYRRRTVGKYTHGKVLVRIFWAMVFELVVLPVPVCGLLFGADVLARGGFAWAIAVMPSMMIYVASCYNLLSDNYIIVDPDASRIMDPADETRRLRRERVEKYFDEKKPYLDPEYRIAEMAEYLYTNRAYISAFINKEYGMNFSRFVNSYRLREVERLREEAKLKRQRISTLQLIMNAGFSSYRSYLRAKEGISEKEEAAGR